MFEFLSEHQFWAAVVIYWIFSAAVSSRRLRTPPLLPTPCSPPSEKLALLRGQRCLPTPFYAA